MNNELFRFIENSPTAFHTVRTVSDELTQLGFTELCEGQAWSVNEGQGYFVTRNGSSLIAFVVPKGDFNGFMIGAAHSDSPCFKLKSNSLITDGDYVRLSAERYGGMIHSTWLDRPLSIAGRVVVSAHDSIKSLLVDFKEPVAMIPNVAIHLNRTANEGTTYNPAVDLVPLYSLADSQTPTLTQRISDTLNISQEDILSYDLFLYNPDKGVQWGDFVSSPRIDDLQCVFSSLKGFVSASPSGSMPVLAVFDNEEVGSSTKQGADSDFLNCILSKIISSMGKDSTVLADKLANSFMLSCDNGHAVHPNHPELTDKTNSVKLNGGVVIKHNASQRYCTDAVSASLVKLLCNRAGVPCQEYSNRSDLPGGSTLGNIANTHASVVTADIGLAQLAMHSSYETAGSEDTEYMVRLMTSFFSSSLRLLSDGCYEI
ncbi:MAG: M18 family aminopeptidase [Ruminococcus sp.]|nr:M18 family aminopeptidase [Ruminococcus sp.]